MHGGEGGGRGGSPVGGVRSGTQQLLQIGRTWNMLTINL